MSIEDKVQELVKAIDALSRDRDDYRRIAGDQELQIEELKESNEKRLDALDIAWGIIANAKDWRASEVSPSEQEWLDAATRWRERYHAILGVTPDGRKEPFIRCWRCFGTGSKSYDEWGCEMCGGTGAIRK